MDRTGCQRPGSALARPPRDVAQPLGRAGRGTRDKLPQRAAVPDLRTDQFLEHPSHGTAHAEPPAVEDVHGHLQREEGKLRALEG